MSYLKLAQKLVDSQFDSVVCVADSIDAGFSDDLKPIHSALQKHKQYNPKLDSEISIVPFDEHPSKKLIFAATGPLDRDYDDGRRITEAACAGLKKALAVQSRKPLLVVGPLNSIQSNQPWGKKPYPSMQAILGACLAAYVPIEIREAIPERATKVDLLGVLKNTTSGLDEDLVSTVAAIEEARRVTRDIMGSDPERMAAPRIAEYVRAEFATDGPVKVTIDQVDGKQYPLMEAVNRAASLIKRHDGRVIKFEYTGQGPIEETLFLVGKGITYDTGGADVKHGGNMAGMHRDKGGASAVTGFFKALELLKPKHLKVVGKCAFVRNSIGANGYVADEIITSRAGKRVRVGNTDAEGRMVMADLLCEAKEQALNEKNPRLFTVATLTGHVIRAYGPDYTGVLGNGASRKLDIPGRLLQAGDSLAEPGELSTLRREDFLAHAGKSEYDDVLQSNNFPSTMTSRGHQSPMAFLTMASGLDKHGQESSSPLPYTHLDCAGSAGAIHSIPTAAPLLLLAGAYILPKSN